MLIRADSSVDIGAGHVSRCAALADALCARGVRPTLLTRDLPGASARATVALDVIVLPKRAGLEDDSAQLARDWLAGEAGPSWLIVDHYDLGQEWECAATARDTRVLVIDDLADRPHTCDMLLDQNLGSGESGRYVGLVSPSCTLLFGPRYALLRSEFAAVRETVKPRDGLVRRVLVFFGGTDPLNLTAVALDAITALSAPHVRFDVVVGSGNPRRHAIRAAAARVPGITFHCQTTNMAELMGAADLGVGAGGSATWERCCVGLPTLVAITAENQRRIVAEATAAEICISMGDARRITSATVAKALDCVLGGMTDLTAMSRAALALVDGHGADRVAKLLLARR